jgi:hypothetical protein
MELGGRSDTGALLRESAARQAAEKAAAEAAAAAKAAALTGAGGDSMLRLHRTESWATSS